MRLLLLLPSLFLLSIAGYPPNFFSKITDDQVFTILHSACKKGTYICPKQEYRIGKLPRNFKWNGTKIVSSGVVKKLRAGGYKNNEIYGAFREEFCCTELPCLRDCNYVGYKIEKKIVADFPKNAEALLRLDDPQINKYKDEILKYVAQYGEKRVNDFSADIEDLFDMLHYRSDRLQGPVNYMQRLIDAGEFKNENPPFMQYLESLRTTRPPKVFEMSDESKEEFRAKLEKMKSIEIDTHYQISY
uniref:Uncharacterized protein n=1 Tax=Caenorhabditis tropicalis TaxID=1561998 RepID=A0A1I7TF30_9PELO